MRENILEIISNYNNDKTRLMDILHDIHSIAGYVDQESIELLHQKLRISEAQVNEVISFYHFYNCKPLAKVNIYLNNSITAKMHGREGVLNAFRNECAVEEGGISEDGEFGLFTTSCIGMNDQEPAAIINGSIFTRLTPYRVRELVKDLRNGKDIKELIYEGDGGGRNALPEINSMVCNNIRRRGALLTQDYLPFEITKKLLPVSTPEDIISIVEASKLRGRGGAGFPTGLKWKFGRKAEGVHHVVICNADEGEPGTFKDRILLTEFPELVFEGMIIAGYSIGADIGLLYLRYEYKYLLNFLKGLLDDMRSKNLLGKNISGIADFNFDIRIQLGAGAYVCGEESALIESLEGKRGEPRDKPPFPVERGYLNYPTVVNNVETLASIPKILKNGSDWFLNLGSNDSAGTKILSVSGDCNFPGIYEVEWGTTIKDVLDMCGAYDVQAIQVGGPSGALIGEKDFNRALSYTDLPTGGSMIVFGNKRNILKNVVMNLMEFFIEESCGSCSTCRNMPMVMKKKLEKILGGRGVESDIDDLLSWSEVLKVSRCGLGQTASNPITTSIKNFRHLYENLVQKDIVFDTGFDLEESVKDSCAAVGRQPILHNL
ncbi:MAG: NAD(P)H-dependent oxidoreductase subunit E [Bacteroidetes bacterium]|nr:NAD(P)H-dependent oxidoreductase subunit E [Bacteroidota bacterium]MBL6942973.1 NAD(P)H-dependent oxidoreductase subunit E [Bacteroidales bacterium]